MKKIDDENKKENIQDENQDMTLIDMNDVFSLSEHKIKAIPLLPFKEVFLPYANKTVKLRKPITRDIKAVANISNQEIKAFHLISNLTGLSIQELENLEFRDFKLLNSASESFL